MKTQQSILILALAGILMVTSCSKTDPDPREAVVGNYTGSTVLLLSGDSYPTNVEVAKSANSGKIDVKIVFTGSGLPNMNLKNLTLSNNNFETPAQEDAVYDVGYSNGAGGFSGNSFTFVVGLTNLSSGDSDTMTVNASR